MSEFLVQFIYILTYVLSLAIFARAILSWFPVNPDNPLVSILVQITEPILAPLRRVVPRVGMFDFTPMVAIVLLLLVQQVVVRLL